MSVVRKPRRSFRWFAKAWIAGLLWIASGGVAGAAQREDAACIGCHTTQGLSLKLPSEEILPLTVDIGVLRSSVHAALQCTNCHTNIRAYPHPKITAHDHRDFQMERYQQCQTCHPDQYRQALDSNHARILAAGNRDGAICVDCHDSHAVAKPSQPREKISTSCGQCHRETYAQYLASAHGRALLEISNPDVPVCTDCHGAHRQDDPRTMSFRLKSPKICAKCHGDAAMMRMYNLSPYVFDTYVADFHGLTVTLFQKEHPDQQTNEAVCTDCHGVHDIQKTSDAGSSVVKENLLNTCRRCHPDAAASFPDSWVGHFPPSRSRFPLVYYVNLFYRILIPATIGGMALFVLIDAGGRIVRRSRRKRHIPIAEDPEA
jgi:predicted CXXCH cytochrome family protein